ncbi:MAG: hypothetical protein U0W24_17385 [Bacteroidales bacterium]
MKNLLILLVFASGLFGCQKSADKFALDPTKKIEFRLAYDSVNNGFEEKELEGKTIFLDTLVLLTQNEISCIYKPVDKEGLSVFNMDFNEKGAVELEKITEANTGKKMAVLVDGKILFCPVIASKISGGKLQVSMNIKQEQLDSIFNSLSGKSLNEK